MLRILKNTRAQASSSEYVLLVGIVVTAMITMTVYFRRAVQARIWAAEHSMIATAICRTGPHHRYNSGDWGNWYTHYEPYYLNTASMITRNDSMASALTSSNFTKTYNTYTSVETNSDTASPRFYLNNLPTDPAANTFILTVNTFRPLP
jgi:uncharacterized protein (UPF0333 family)